MASVIGFPDPVNEVSARVVAAGVVVFSIATIALDQPWMTAIIAYGFVARVLTGPTLSPLGQLATRVITPRLPVGPRLIPGPPKRFAQGMGAVMSITAALLALAFGLVGAAYAVLTLLIVAASLEAVLGLCLGCRIFALLMRTGVIPAEVCERCVTVPSVHRPALGQRSRGRHSRMTSISPEVSSVTMSQARGRACSGGSVFRPPLPTGRT